MAALSKMSVYCPLIFGTAGSNPAGDMVVSCECFELSFRGPCVWLITHPEESYTECGVPECDREATIMRGPWPTGGGGELLRQGEKKIQELKTVL